MADHGMLTTWLKDAYGMEKALIPVLKEHADDAKDYPEVRSRDLQHVEETRRHAELVEECLHRLGEKPSKMKSAMGEVFGRIQGMGTKPFKDDVMKNFIADYAAEQFEIASYKAIIAAARAQGEEEIARTCEGILAEEEDMARWLDERMTRIARESERRAEA